MHDDENHPENDRREKFSTKKTCFIRDGVKTYKPIVQSESDVSSSLSSILNLS
jgi:hypothetical protein